MMDQIKQHTGFSCLRRPPPPMPPPGSNPPESNPSKLGVPTLTAASLNISKSSCVDGNSPGPTTVPGSVTAPPAFQL
jgi:hypothetical protein